jgi:beta-lactamase class A
MLAPTVAKHFERPQITRGEAMLKIPVGLVAVLLIGAVAAAGCGSGTTERTRSVTRTTEQASAAGFPATPAGRQLRWFVTQLNSGRVPATAEISAHFTPAFLKAVPPAKFVSSLVPLAADGPFRYGGSQPASSPEQLVARFDGAKGTSVMITIVVTHETPHLISGLLIQLAAPKLVSWKATDAALVKLADRPSMLAAEVRSGHLETVHAIYPDRAGAIGSAFKLYVLGALGRAIEAGKASWQEELAINSAWKSIPSGEMQNEPAGKRFPIRRYAGQMIAISDNTATDHLIRRLGRSVVEKAFVQLGNHSATRNVPLLTTREMTVLKLNAPVGLMHKYARADSAARQRLIPRIDAIALSTKGVAAWTTPRAIETIEWFASPADLGRAMAGLARLARVSRLAPIRSILSKNPGIPVDTKVWRYVGYKGGSEPGVVSLAWYLERRDGRAFVLAIVLNDRKHDIDLLPAMTASTGAIELLSRS